MTSGGVCRSYLVAEWLCKPPATSSMCGLLAAASGVQSRSRPYAGFHAGLQAAAGGLDIIHLTSFKCHTSRRFWCWRDMLGSFEAQRHTGTLVHEPEAFAYHHHMQAKSAPTWLAPLEDLCFVTAQTSMPSDADCCFCLCCSVTSSPLTRAT